VVGQATLTVVRAGHAREKARINPNAIALTHLTGLLLLEGILSQYRFWCKSFHPKNHSE
jgi:hypothetical protein